MRTCLLLGLLTLLAGCAFPPGGWDSPEPAARLGAITEAARTRDQAAIPHLIESLNHDDPVVRMAAIRTLQELTGQTLGYDYAAPEWERCDKVMAWVEWYRQKAPNVTVSERSRAGNPDSIVPIEKGWARR